VIIPTASSYGVGVFISQNLPYPRSVTAFSRDILSHERTAGGVTLFTFAIDNHTEGVHFVAFSIPMAPSIVVDP